MVGIINVIYQNFTSSSSSCLCPPQSTLVTRFFFTGLILLLSCWRYWKALHGLDQWCWILYPLWECYGTPPQKMYTHTHTQTWHVISRVHGGYLPLFLFATWQPVIKTGIPLVWRIHSKFFRRGPQRTFLGFLSRHCQFPKCTLGFGPTSSLTPPKCTVHHHCT